MNSISGSSGNDTITGTLADDEIFSGDGNDTITGSAGNDEIYGGKDTDTAFYASAYSNYNVIALYNGKNNSFSGFTISDLMGAEGVDTVFSDVEYLTFSSGTVTYKVDNGNLSLIDINLPTIAVASSATSLISSQTAILTFTLSESSANFLASDVTVSGGTLSNFAGSGTTYTALFTPTANSTTNGVVSVSSGVFTDAAGNANADGSDANNTVTMSVDTVPVAITQINTLSVIVDQGVLGSDAVLLRDLKETTTTLDGRVQSHKVEYAGVVFGFAEIDSLITTVTRDGEFTQEFRVEIAQAYPGVENILYADAVAIVGIANIDQILLGVAGFDGNFVS